LRVGQQEVIEEGQWAVEGVGEAGDAVWDLQGLTVVISVEEEPGHTILTDTRAKGGEAVRGVCGDTVGRVYFWGAGRLVLEAEAGQTAEAHVEGV
jgi:hypothetical protein